MTKLTRLAKTLNCDLKELVEEVLFIFVRCKAGKLNANAEFQRNYRFL